MTFRPGLSSKPLGRCAYHGSPVHDTLMRFCEYVWTHRPEVGGTAYPSECVLVRVNGADTP